MFCKRIISLILVSIWLATSAFAVDYKFISEKKVYSSSQLSDILAVMQPATGTKPTGTLIIPEGVTAITQPIYLSAGQSIIGDPTASTKPVIRMDITSNTVIKVIPTTATEENEIVYKNYGGNLRIENLVITRSNTATRSSDLGVGIYLYGSPQVTIENCLIRGHSIGIKQTNSITRTYLNRYKNCTIEWCTVNAMYLSHFVGFYLTNITCKNIGTGNNQNTVAAVWLEGGEGIYIRGLNVSKCTGKGILFSKRADIGLKCQNMYVDDSVIHAAGGVGIDVQDMGRLAITDSTVTLSGSKYVNVVGLYAIGAYDFSLDTSSTKVPCHGISIIPASGSTVENVIVDSCESNSNGEVGVKANNAKFVGITRSKINNNSFYNTYAAGPFFGVTMWKNTVTKVSSANDNIVANGASKGFLCAKNTLLGGASYFISNSVNSYLYVQ